MPQEKLVYLQELLAIIPKHKGTEKLQADLKSKISKIKDALISQKKSKGSGGSWFQVERQGAGQVVLVGLPNCGKSSVLNTLTNAHADVALYPFTTTLPQVGMMDYENIKIQIVDTPPLHDDAPAWLFGIYRNSNFLLIILDGAGDLFQDFENINYLLNNKNISIRPNGSGDVKQALIMLNKIDKIIDASLKERFINQLKNEFRIIPFTTNNTADVDIIKREIFEKLNLIRVYTKKIGYPVNKDEPVVLKKGLTIIDAAEHIHKDFKKNLKFARLWNDAGYAGQRVEKNHVLIDGDVIEFHV